MALQSDHNIKTKVISHMTYKKSGQFQVNKQNIKQIGDLYGQVDLEFKVADSGIENSTIIVKNEIKFVIRVYRHSKKSDSDILREIDFMELLHDNKIVVPRILPNTSGEKLSKINLDNKEWSVIAMEYIAGHHPEQYNDKIIAQLAVSHAAIHKIGIRFAKQSGEKPQRLLVPGEFTDLIDDSIITDERVKALVGRAREYDVELDSELEYGYVHNDYDIENTLFDDSNTLLGILDFDDLAVMPVVVCLAFSLWSVLFDDDDTEGIKLYMRIYNDARNLKPLELLYIPRILLFRHYAITALFVLEGEMSEKNIQKCEQIESTLLSMVINNLPMKY